MAGCVIELTSNSIEDVKSIGIYLITCTSLNKIYVGSTRSKYGFEGRWTSHLSNLKQNKHCNRFLQNYVNKYGTDSLKFEILEVCNKDVLLERELHWVKTLDSVNNGFNLVYPNTRKNIKKNDKYFFIKKPAVIVDPIPIIEANYRNIFNSFYVNDLSIKELSNKYKLRESIIHKILSGKSFKINKQKIKIPPL